ncbi:microtubule-associated protein futsch-like isoform X2 [Poeciliopsis prolifica]|nr:microtubule-associated protein futsch-like isoform X2 [Poeciliopsis prolifica]
MNNVLAVGGCAPTLTSNTHIPAPGLPTKPPSPTAVAINLLNLLKIVNTMSHPMYNPFGPGKQMPSQGPYGLSGGQMEMDPQRPPPHFGSGSNFSSSGSSGLTHGSSGGPIPSIMSLPGNYRPERNKITVDEDIDRCLDLNISRAREEVIQISSSQNTQFTNVQRDPFPSSNKGMPSYLTSATLVNRSFTLDSSNNSLDWLPICQRGSEEESSKKYSSASSSFPGSGASVFSTSSEGKHMSSIPGLGDYDIKRPAKSVPPSEPIRPKYTSESASNILLHFGLEKEDLEHLISYPEDQITPENLPFILRQIKLEKEKKAATAVQSKPYCATQPIRSMGEKDKFIPSIRAGFNSDQISSTVLKPSKVIEYGHTGKYTTGVGNVGSSAVAGVGGSLLCTDTFKPSSHVRDPLQRGQGDLKTGPVVSSHSQISSVSTVDSLRSPVAPSSRDLSKKLGVQTSQNSTSLFPSFGLLNKDTELRLLKPEGPQIPPPKQPEPACQASTQPQSFNPLCNLSRGVHPGRPGLVLIHSNDSHNNKSKTQGQGLKAPEQANKIPAQQQPIQQNLQHQGPPPQKPQFQMHPQPIPSLKQVQGLPATVPTRLSLFPLRPALPTPAQVPICPSLPMSAPMLLRPSPPTPAQGRMDAMPHMPPPVFKDQTSVPKMGPSKLPTPAMMQDYAAATPKIFPHTCCLCMKECTNMKDWLSHQNTSLHLDSCRLLRLRYPDWDGTTLELLSGPGKGTQASPTTLDQSFHETRSHSLSPHRQHGSEDSKESPHHYYGSESRRQKRSSRSRSRSPQCHRSSDGQRERRSSRSPHASRHSRRSRSRSYDRPTSSHHRSRSRSYERRSPSRKREARRLSPRRSYERRPSPRRSDERHSSPWSSREARSPAARSGPQHKRSRSADRLAKRLLETTAVQSLSKQSNLEAMVKTLAPALLAELAKMKSSSNTEKKTSSAKSSKATSSRPKSGKSSSAKPMSAESAGKVRLFSVSASLSHDDIFEALEQFGKVKEVIIARASLQAIIHFEKEADAEKLKKLKCLQVKGLTVYVDKKMNIVSKKPQSAQKSAPQKKSAESSTTFTGKDKTPALPGAKTITTGKVATKAKGVPTKQVAVKKPNTAGKSAVKLVGDSGIHKTKSPVKTSNADDSTNEATNTKPENYEMKSETPSETAEVIKMLDTTVGDEHKEEKMASLVKEVTHEAETSSNPVKAETQPDTLGVKDLEFKSATSENQPVAAKAESEELPLVTKTVDILETSEENQVEECLKVDSVRIKVEDVEPGKTEPEEPMEILSSAESKDQVSETVKPAARVKTPPCSSFPRKTSADPPQTQQTTVKTEEMSERDSLQEQPCPMEESEPPAGKVKTETEQLQSPKKMETMQKEQSATDVSSHLTPELVSDVVAVKLEEPTSAGKKTADGTAAPADVLSLTATVKTEKQEQQKETKRTPQKTVKSSMPLSKDSHNEKQPPPQTCASVYPTPAEPIQSGSVKADMKAGKNETEVVAIPTMSRKSNENSERKQSPRAPVVPAEKQTIPVPYTSTTSVTALGKLQDDDAELPQIDEDFFRALTTALREHRLRQGEKKTSEESSTISKTTSEGMKEEYTPLTQDESKEEDNYSDPFDEFDFNFGDFVTVDEISEEMDDTLVETEVENTSVSLESISRATTEKLSPDVSSVASETSTRSSITCKISTSSSSKSEKGSDSLSSASEPENKQKLSSEPPKFETKTSSVSGVKPKSSSTPSNSLKTPLSSQSNKSQPLVRSLETSSGRSTRSSAAANKSSVGTQQVGKKDVKPKESVVAKSDHHVSAESCSANTVESQLRIKTSKIQPTEGQSSQIQNLKTDFKNVKEMKKNEVKDKKKDMDGKSTEEKGGNNGNKQILDSFKEKSDEQKNKDGNQDRRTEIQMSGVEQDQLILQGANNNSPSDGCQEMEVDESTKLQDCALKNQAATAHDEETNQTPNSSSVKQNDIRLSERVCETSREFGQNSNEEDQNDSRHFDTLKDQKLVVPTDLLSKADDEEAYEVIDSLDDQQATTEAESEREKKEQKKKESTTTCGGDGPTRKGRSRSQTFKSEEKENSPKQQDKTRTYVTQRKDGKIEKEEESLEDFEEMVYEVVDSIEDDSVQEPSTTGNSSRRRTPRRNKKDEKTSPPVEEPKKSDDEEEEMFTVLDSVEEESPSDKPVVARSTRGRRQNIAKKVEENTKMKQDKTPTRRRCTPVRDSKEKDGEKTPKIDVPLKKSTPTKSDSAVPSTGDEDTVCMELDAVVYDQPTTQKPKRGKPKDNKTSQKQSEEEEEPVYEIVDSVEEDQENTMTVTSRQENETKVEMTADVNIVSLTKVKEDKSPTRRRTPARDAKEKDRVQLKESAQTKKSDTAVASTGEVDDTYKQLIAVKEGQPRTQKSRRGRPKKDNKTSKKQSEEEEEPVYQIVDSLEGDQENTMTVESSLNEDSEPNIKMTADFNTVLFTKLGEDRTLTRRQCTSTRDSHEKDVVSLKESTPTQTSNAAVVNTREEDTIIEELDAVENGQSATQKPGRGRPKKKNKTSKKLTKEEETVYQIVDTLEGDQDKTMMVASLHMEETEEKVEMTENVNTVLFSEMKEDKILTRGQCTPARDSKEKDRVPLKESTPTKKSNAALTSTGDEDSTYEEFNAPEDGQPTTQKPRRGRPKKNNKTSKKQTEEDEEPAHQIVDSLEDLEKNVRVEVSLQEDSETKVEMAANANIDLFTKTKEGKKFTKRRHTPARDSQENDREKTPKPDVCIPLMESTPTKENDARHLGGEETSYEVLDAFEEEVVEQARRASRRERPKKDNKTSEKPTENLKVDSPRKDEEEATYQILDSVEDEVVDDVAPVDQSECAKMSSTFEDDDITKEMIRSLLNKEEGGTIYQIVDSLEEDHVQEEMMTETAMQEESVTTGDMIASTDHTLSSPSTVEPSEQTGGQKEIQLAGKTLEDKEDSSIKGSDTEGKESTLEVDIVEKDESSNKPNDHLCASEENMPTSPKSKDTEATENILVNLDQVSEDEEDFPDDAAEEEELKKRQAAAKKRENDREDKRSREREAMERRSRSSSKGRSRKSTWEPEKTSQQDLEKVEVDAQDLVAQDLVTLDEVGGDEVGEEAVTEAPTWKVELTEGELQDLVTLDEIVEEEEGQLEAPPESLGFSKVRGLSKLRLSDSLKSETLTEIAQTEDNKDDDNHPKERSSSSKHKLDDITEENGKFVTVDEVGEIEEEEEKEAVKRTGRPKKRCRLTPVRKATRGKTVKEENHSQEEGENKSLPPASLDSSSTLDTPGPSGDVQSETQRKEEGKNTEAVSTEHQPLPNDGLKLGFEEAEKQEHRRAGVKVVDKRTQEPTGPEAKRSRSQSPSVSLNLQLPPFNPKNPLGKEFVNPTSGFFCSLCSVFYLNEDTAKELHCSSREHYDNLKNYYQRLQQNVQGSLSD